MVTTEIYYFYKDEDYAIIIDYEADNDGTFEFEVLEVRLDNGDYELVTDIDLINEIEIALQIEWLTVKESIDELMEVTVKQY